MLRKPGELEPPAAPRANRHVLVTEEAFRRIRILAAARGTTSNEVIENALNNTYGMPDIEHTRGAAQ